MYDNLTGIKHRSAIVDVTDRCNLRCTHCFYFREEHDSREMDDDAFLAGLRTLRDRHQIQSMGWCGGEPLFRREVVLAGTKLFPMNQLFTNGTLPLPETAGMIPFVSLDGTREVHDQVRGRGTYDKIMANLRQAPVAVAVFIGTFHRQNHHCLEELVGELSGMKKPQVGFLAMTFTPLKSYRQLPGYAHSEVQETQLDFSWEERDRFLDRLLALKRKYPALVANVEANLQMMKSENAAAATSRCNMPQRTLTLDLNLERKLPCVLGSEVDCAKCGCPFPYEQEARRRGLKEKTFFRV